MRPVNDDMQPWDDRVANFVLQDIRARALANLNDRDERRSQGQLNAANRYSPYREVVNDRGTGSTFEVDPVLVAMKYTGAELAHLTGKRWAEFCVAPQDEKPYAEKLLQSTRDKALQSMQVVGQSVEDSLKTNPEPVVPLPPSKTKKRDPALIG